MPAHRTVWNVSVIISMIHMGPLTTVTSHVPRARLKCVAVTGQTAYTGHVSIVFF